MSITLGLMSKKLVSRLKTKNSVKVVEGEYDVNDFLEAVKGLEDEPEGGARCEKCFRLRLNEAAVFSRELGVIISQQRLQSAHIKILSL